MSRLDDKQRTHRPPDWFWQIVSDWLDEYADQILNWLFRHLSKRPGHCSAFAGLLDSADRQFREIGCRTHTGMVERALQRLDSGDPETDARINRVRHRLRTIIRDRHSRRWQ